MAVSAKAEQRITEDEWQRLAMSSATAAARELISGGSINARAGIGSLGDVEWGWIVAAVIFGWVKTRAEQAVAEGTPSELTIRSLSVRQPEPWEAGAIHTILPQLGGLDMDWSKPLANMSKDEITKLAWHFHKLSDQALARRDEGSLDRSTKTQFDPARAEREISAANGGSLLSRNEPELLAAG